MNEKNSKKKILIIDDEPSIRNLIADFLKSESYQVFTAADGTVAIPIVLKENPALVFLDLNLAGTNGLDVLKQIKAKSPQTCVIMLSGGQDEEIAKKAIELGAFDYLTKPISLRKLLNEVIDKVFQE